MWSLWDNFGSIENQILRISALSDSDTDRPVDTKKMFCLKLTMLLVTEWRISNMALVYTWQKKLLYLLVCLYRANNSLNTWM